MEDVREQEHYAIIVNTCPDYWRAIWHVEGFEYDGNLESKMDDNFTKAQDVITDINQKYNNEFVLPFESYQQDVYNEFGAIVKGDSKEIKLIINDLIKELPKGSRLGYAKAGKWRSNLEGPVYEETGPAFWNAREAINKAIRNLSRETIVIKYKPKE